MTQKRFSSFAVVVTTMAPLALAWSAHASPPAPSGHFGAYEQQARDHQLRPGFQREILHLDPVLRNLSRRRPIPEHQRAHRFAEARARLDAAKVESRLTTAGERIVIRQLESALERAAHDVGRASGETQSLSHEQAVWLFHRAVERRVPEDAVAALDELEREHGLTLPSGVRRTLVELARGALRHRGADPSAEIAWAVVLGRLHALPDPFVRGAIAERAVRAAERTARGGDLFGTHELVSRDVFDLLTYGEPKGDGLTQLHDQFLRLNMRALRIGWNRYQDLAEDRIHLTLDETQTELADGALIFLRPASLSALDVTRLQDDMGALRILTREARRFGVARHRTWYDINQGPSELGQRAQALVQSFQGMAQAGGEDATPGASGGIDFDELLQAVLGDGADFGDDGTPSGE